MKNIIQGFFLASCVDCFGVDPTVKEFNVAFELFVDDALASMLLLGTDDLTGR